MSDYIRTIPRDLFCEADLLKMLGRLYILLENRADAGFDQETVPVFDVRQDPSSGSISVANLTFSVRGRTYRLQRPLNSRQPWPLWLDDPEDADFEEVRVFTEEGEIGPEMAELLGDV